jgi:hypothetical protein
MDNCKICNGITKQVFTTKILKKYDVAYYQCTDCDFVQTEKPFWLAEAYENPMNFSDTGIMHRNNKFSKIVTSLIFLFFDKNEKFLDYAGGYGVFTRIMRDIGFDFYWTDPYTKNLLSRGFEEKSQDKFHLITSFECFEHLDDPMTEISKMIARSKNIIFSTELAPKPLPKPENWWYYGTEHGQHIALYSTKSLEIVASKFGLNYHNIGNLHLFTEKKISVLGTLFLKFKFSQHLLYLMYFFCSFFMTSKTMSDMQTLKKQ